MGQHTRPTSRLTGLFRGHESRSRGRPTGGAANRRWRSEVVCPTPAPPLVFQEDVRAVNEYTARLARLEPALNEHVHSWRLNPVVAALPARRGVQCTVAVTPVAALGDLTRVDHPTELRQDLGLTPADYTRGERRRQGSIPTAGHTHARRVLVEGAWASRYPANVSRPLPLRREHQANGIQAISWKAQVRRCQRSRRLLARGTHAHQVVGAMARE
jgi:transposase